MSKWVLATLTAALILTGCGNGADNNRPQAETPGNNVQAQQYDPGKKLIEDPKAVELHLEELAASVDGVEAAHCVVIGNTAIVGLDVGGEVERSRVGTIKYAVAEAFRNDPYGIDAFVTADLDMSNRLAEIREDIVKGRPVAGFAEELADIIGRLIPQLPRYLSPVQPDPDAIDRVLQPVEGKSRGK